MMIPRYIEPFILKSFENVPVIALLGPRQVGKTTLAQNLAQKISDKKSVEYLDLENEIDLAKLNQKQLFLSGFHNKLLIIDEIQRAPELFPVMRGLIDERRRAGEKGGHFFILGSASRDLLRQSSESLAGRIRYIELKPFSILEARQNMEEPFDINRLWYRGGFPESYMASNDDESWNWRGSFISTYVERDIPLLGPHFPAERLRNFWSMLGFQQGTQLNQDKLAGALEVSSPTIRNYLDVLTDLYMVRQLRPWFGNSKKRLVRSPKVYIRDSGLLHRLVQISDPQTLLGHPIVGVSWEGFVIENILAHLSDKWQYSYYRTQAGAEVDLILEGPKNQVWAVEIKRTLSPKISKGFIFGSQDVGATNRFFVHAGEDRFPLSQSTQAIGIVEFIEEILEA